MVPIKLNGSTRNVLRPWRYTFPFRTPAISEFFLDEYFVRGRENIIRLALVDEVRQHPDLAPGYLRYKSFDAYLTRYDPRLVVDVVTDPQNWCQLCRWWTYDLVSSLPYSNTFPSDAY